MGEFGCHFRWTLVINFCVMTEEAEMAGVYLEEAETEEAEFARSLVEGDLEEAEFAQSSTEAPAEA